MLENIWSTFSQHLLTNYTLNIVDFEKNIIFTVFWRFSKKCLLTNCHFKIVKWIMTKNWSCICLSQNKFWDIAWPATINELSEFFSTQKWFRKITISCVLGGKQNSFLTIQDIQWLSNSIYNNEVVEISGVYFHMRWVYGNM